MKLAVLPALALGATAAIISGQRTLKHQLARPLLSASTASALKMKILGVSPSLRATSDIPQQRADSALGGAVVYAPDIIVAGGTFAVPEAKQPETGPTAGLPTTYAASFWVGIDGVACPTASLRGGVDVFWDPEGTSYNAWFQWAPAQSQDFVIAVKPGDVVRVTATANVAAEVEGAADDVVAGTLAIENLTTNQTRTHTFLVGEIPALLCREEAAWVVHDFILEQGPGLPAPFANFTGVEFFNAHGLAGGPPSPVVLDTQATVLDIVQAQQGGRLTECAAGDGKVTCKRTVDEA